ncbi:anthranilate synthase component I family protein [Streptomyces sp. NBC_00878]|uniref:anthranilate synthase component I family protein n=1 Tax=Streptomyces sp. NBC_00878 TaxID=2975854 RepID=UPI002255A8CC|nr:anthranilate synthase component I family protein [Streptomyces sp. NBC_00878]MCX4904519.1 anthranilate synthase component I family protein [Streptomyces sp. NBC_00878]
MRLTEVGLPRHAPLDLYTLLRQALGADGVFVLEGLGGPKEQRGPAVVGLGRLAEIRVYADHIDIDGCATVLKSLVTRARAVGLTETGETGEIGETGAAADSESTVCFAIDDSGQVWQLLESANLLFDVRTEVPTSSYAFGFLAVLGYEAAWHMEKLPPRAGGTGTPDLTLTLFRDTVSYDSESGAVRLLRADLEGEGEAFPRRSSVDVVEFARQAGRMAGPPPLPPAPRPRAVEDSVPRETFLTWARQCLAHIRSGDIYQIQIGHRIDVESDLRPLDVYRRLSHRNPSPYMYLVPYAGSTLIGASPELFFRTRNGEITMRPIAGTTRRGTDDEENLRRIKAMQTSSKEQAEHIMLVDLCRNDIGRVSLPGTLPVDQLMAVESFSHVFHLVSTVTGRLAPEASVWDTMRATFPAGTMSGAPKVRAMEIIAGLEREPRGSYAGAVGLIDVRGWSELALCIRTIAYDGRRYSAQSSAGIVAESQPEAEWDETLAKLGAAYWALTGEELTA